VGAVWREKRKNVFFIMTEINLTREESGRRARGRKSRGKKTVGDIRYT